MYSIPVKDLSSSGVALRVKSDIVWTSFSNSLKNVSKAGDNLLDSIKMIASALALRWTSRFVHLLSSHMREMFGVWRIYESRVVEAHETEVHAEMSSEIRPYCIALGLGCTTEHEYKTGHNQRTKYVETSLELITQ